MQRRFSSSGGIVGMGAMQSRDLLCLAAYSSLLLVVAGLAGVFVVAGEAIPGRLEGGRSGGDSCCNGCDVMAVDWV